MVQSTCSESTERYLLKFKLKNDSSDPDTPKPERLKSLGHLSNQLKKDAFGITSLREKNGILRTDTKEKAIIYNRQI